MPPTVSSSQAQRFPEMTAIRVEYWDRDDRWIADQVSPVFTTKSDRPSVTRWKAANALPEEGARILANGGSGAEVDTDAPEYIDYQITEGQLTAKVPRKERAAAERDGDPDRPYRIRTKKAVGLLKMENELRSIEYYDPTRTATFAGGDTSHVIDTGHNWLTYNPLTDEFISDDIAMIRDFFDLKNQTQPNFGIISTRADQFFVRKLARERNSSVILSSSGGDYADLLPSVHGKVLGGMKFLVPGSRSEATPADASYNPQRVWRNFPYLVVGYSPTLDGSLWDGTGDAYVGNAEYVEDGQEPFETFRQDDPLIAKNGLVHMWWNFNRQLKLLKPTLVAAVGPIY